MHRGVALYGIQVMSGRLLITTPAYIAVFRFGVDLMCRMDMPVRDVVRASFRRAEFVHNQ